MAVPSSRVRRLCRRNRKRKFVLVPAIIESFLIKRRRFAKAIFIYRDFGQPFVNGLWDVFDDAGWMVRFLVDVQWNVSWFVVWQVFTVNQVKCDVKKGYYLLIGLDSNLQTVLGENATCHFQVRPSKSRFFRSERINKRIFRFRTQIKCDVENLKPGPNPVW